MTTQADRNHPLREALASLARGTGRLFLHFLLPLFLLGPVLYGAEKLAEHLRFHGSETQFLRMLSLGLYAIVIFAVMRPKGNKGDKGGKDKPGGNG